MNCKREVRASYIRGRDGVCNACREYRRLHGVDRPADKPFRKYPPGTPCTHCGRVDKYLSLGLCSRCHNYLRRTGKLPALKVITHCRDCGREIKPTRRGRGLCSRCSAYLWRHGKHWTPEISKRSKHEPAPICECCRERPANNRIPKPMCDRCNLYWKRTGKFRPRWRDADSCKVCGKPRQDQPRTFVLGRCLGCYEYWRNHGRKGERPAHLWGKGEHGWCDCGNPATHVVTVIIKNHTEEFTLCDECYKEHQRQVAWYGA